MYLFVQNKKNKNSVNKFIRKVVKMSKNFVMVGETPSKGFFQIEYCGSKISITTSILSWSLVLCDFMETERFPKKKGIKVIKILKKMKK